MNTPIWMGNDAGMESFFSNARERAEHKDNLFKDNSGRYSQGYWYAVVNCLHMIHENKEN